MDSALKEQIKLVKELKKGKMKRLYPWLADREQKLFNIGYSYMSRSEDVEDALQNTVMRVIEKIGTLKEPAYFETWLIRILINECRQLIRRNSKTVFLAEKDLPDRKNNSPERVSIEVADLLQPLEEEVKEVILLKYIGGYTHREIAESMELPESSVKTKIHRGLQTVRKAEERGMSL